MRAYWAAACGEVAGPDVQVAQQLGRGPVAGLLLHQAGVLGDGRVQATLAQQLFGSPEGLVAVHRPGGQDAGGGSPPDAILSNSDAGRNERR